jgi:NADPH-dependent 2,4-dienoyl-CoA reductase/sulfur reductase-like enzyme
MNAAAAMRVCDPTASITIISNEPPYARMALPYYLTGEAPYSKLFPGGREVLERLGVETLPGESAARLDLDARRIELASEGEVEFDRLLLATGSSPTVLPVPGVSLPGVFTFWTLADAEKVLCAAQACVSSQKPEVVMIGAGFIGLIVLSAMLKLGWKVHVVESMPQVLPRMLDLTAAKVAEEWLRGRGIDILTGSRVLGIECDLNGRKLVSIEGHAPLTSDLVILAVGVKANTSLAQAAGLEVGEGIRVNQHLETSQAGIYAAGDVAQGPDFLGGPNVVSAVQPTAVEHGRVAGANMAGREFSYPGSLAMNVLNVGGLYCASLGAWGEDLQGGEAYCEVPTGYRKLVFKDGRLVGAILLGPATGLMATSDLGMIKGLIQSRVDLSSWQERLSENPWEVRRAFFALRTPEILLADMPNSPCSLPGLDRFIPPPPGGRRPSHFQMFGGEPAIPVSVKTPPYR